MKDELNEFDDTIKKLSYAYHIEPLEPSDIAQELRITLWINRNKYDKNKGSYKSWAYMVCRNKLKDLHKYNISKKRDIRREQSLDELAEKGLDIMSPIDIEDTII